VNVSLAGTMRFFRSLGQYENLTGFGCERYDKQNDVPSEWLEECDSAFGLVQALRHSASIEGVILDEISSPKLLGRIKLNGLHD
jgi:hypothetical protein